jgi:hypothetical protein
MLVALWTAALAVSGFLVGNEIAVGAFVHPQLWKLDDAVHVRAAQVIARIYGALAPFWYATTLLLNITVTWSLYRSDPSVGFWLAATAALIWLCVIVWTLLALAPVNAEVANWNLNDLPAEWQQRRVLWDRRHRLRVFVIGLAFLLLTVAILSRH